MKTEGFVQLFARGSTVKKLTAYLRAAPPATLSLQGLSGSAAPVMAAASLQAVSKPCLFILSDKETAAYFFNDLENLLGEKEKSYESRNSFFFPASLKKPFHPSAGPDKAGALLRSEVLTRLASEHKGSLVVTYPEALCEKVIPLRELKKQSLTLQRGDQLSVDFLMDILLEYGFEHVDFVVEPGQFSVRGGIIDVFSFSNDHPYRIEIMGQQAESLRSFNTETQLSLKMHERISILPDIGVMTADTPSMELLLDSMPRNTLVWIEDTNWCLEVVGKAFEDGLAAEGGFASAGQLLEALKKRRVVEFRKAMLSKENGHTLTFNCSPQPNFNKQFEMLLQKLENNSAEGTRNVLLFDTPSQVNRIRSIFDSLLSTAGKRQELPYHAMLMTLHAGFTDHELGIACYTDHQIFDRYHRYRIRDKFPGKQALSIQSLYKLKPGDYVTHIDHGIGVFSGLEKIEVHGRLQEAIRLIYKNNDILYVSIHSLHRISKYSGREGAEPALHRLGSNAWNRLKSRTKKKVKDIAKDLIALYAKRRARKGHAFPPDNYLQHELEASFVYEDTPDQEKATTDVKKDMESPCPMDRLICGDVGFGKTEVAIRAAFKAVCDSRQVAVLVPTTILALQHYYTFKERLRDFPCKVDYVSRFRSVRDRKAALAGASGGSVDILIGTHRLLGKDVRFKDLGLLIVDEEQKFGVTSKEKLKQLRVDVDTLTLTATPIPRTLQFSLMGARDLSYINTPPPNRYPIITELHSFNEDLIRDAIVNEVSRGGQVFFVHNRVQNIREVAAIVGRVCPGTRIAIGHGQLEGNTLEKVMVDFVNGEYDVLVSTTIIESGLDIPNANTIIINNAHHFGLSDLHQMRGRVGRTNRKAYCYLLSPPMSTLTDEARKRLRAIEEFSELGSGFNIAMRDLDIRGAGNLLGAEQSGFISEVGLDTYHKILDEAVQELKDTEFRDLFADKAPAPEKGRKECQLETDLELMIPSDYVTNTEERLQLYKELDSLPDESRLQLFAGKLRDRFGPMPPAVSGLLQAVRFRWTAARAGFEKVILKRGKMIGQLPESETSGYYQGEEFGRLLQYTLQHPGQCQIRDAGGRLAMTIEEISDMDKAMEVITFLSGSH